jgi:hypothetical protein
VSSPFGFRAFTTKYGQLVRAIVTPIGVCPAFDPKSPPKPEPTYVEVRALWDTGATNSCITAPTAKSLGLRPTGSAVVYHVDGSCTRTTYLVNMMLPNRVGAAGVRVTECDTVAGDFGVIIGMDIISSGDFSITNVGAKTCVSFRMPSLEEVDYVAEGKRLRDSAVGRNDLCPCGSGKKYKKCCWKASNT